MLIMRIIAPIILSSESQLLPSEYAQVENRKNFLQEFKKSLAKNKVM